MCDNFSFLTKKCVFVKNDESTRQENGKDVSIAMIGYNVFSLAKRFEAYETLGGLFEHATAQAMELTIALRIWDSYWNYCK